MKIWNEQPANSFWETGFYFGLFPQWRYTGKYGLVKHNISLASLPKPYGDTETINGVLSVLPWHLIKQIAVSFKTFGLNLTKLYGNTGPFAEDLTSVPLALVDFIPATFTTIASVLAPIWLPIVVITQAFSSSKNDNDDDDDEYIHNPYNFGPAPSTIAILGSPFIVIAGVFVGLYGLISAGLMFAKAGIETALSILTTTSIPLKGLMTGICALANKIVSKDSKKDDKGINNQLDKAPEVSNALTTLGGSINPSTTIQVEEQQNTYKPLHQSIPGNKSTLDNPLSPQAGA